MKLNSIAFVSALFAAIFCVTSCRAEDTKDTKDAKDDPAAQEQKFVDDLTTKNEMSTLCGALLVGTTEEKPAANKQAGTLKVGKENYVVIIMKEDQFKTLQAYDKQTVTVVGYVADKPDLGKVIYFDHIESEAALAPSKRKRGGF